MTDRKYSLIIITFIFGIIGALIIRYNNPKEMNINKIDQNIISNLKNERDQYLQEIDRLEDQIYYYEKEGIKNDQNLTNIYTDIEKLKIASGYSDVIGPGIIIKLEDGNNSNSKIVDDIGSLLKLISVLNSAGAEAISINDERYNSFTEIERASEHLIINGRITNTPLEIKAIGNPDILESALTIKGGASDYYKEILGSNFDIYITDNITINKVWDKRDFHYINIE